MQKSFPSSLSIQISERSVIKTEQIHTVIYYDLVGNTCNLVPLSCSPVFQYKYCHFSVFCIHFQYFSKSSTYAWCMYWIPPNFQYFWNFISIYGQNSVKILTNLYTWRYMYYAIKAFFGIKNSLYTDAVHYHTQTSSSFHKSFKFQWRGSRSYYISTYNNISNNIKFEQYIGTCVQ